MNNNNYHQSLRNAISPVPLLPFVSLSNPIIYLHPTHEGTRYTEFLRLSFLFLIYSFPHLYWLVLYEF